MWFRLPLSRLTEFSRRLVERSSQIVSSKAVERASWGTVVVTSSMVGWLSWGGWGALCCLAFPLGLGFYSAWRAVRARRRDYQSGSWQKVQRALRYDLRYGGSANSLKALALAGVGDFASARRALLRPSSGALDEEREISLCTRVVIASFEGRLELALGLCRQLVELPFEPGRAERERRTARRAGVIAIARALSGTADEIDYEELSLTASLEPALYWPCRYGIAASCWARDECDLARWLLSGAPSWPKESAFFSLHLRIFRSADGRPGSRPRAVANL